MDDALEMATVDLYAMAAKMNAESAKEALRQLAEMRAERDALAQSCADWKETHEETIASMGAQIQALRAERDALRARVVDAEPLPQWTDVEGWEGMVDESADGSPNVRIILWDGKGGLIVHVVPAEQALGIAAALVGFARAVQP